MFTHQAFPRFFASLAVLIALLGGTPVHAGGGFVETFAVLPSGACNRRDHDQAATSMSRLSVSQRPARPRRPARSMCSNKSGKLLRTLMVSGSSANLLGLAFHPSTGDLLVIDNGNSKVLKVNPDQRRARRPS